MLHCLGQLFIIMYIAILKNWVWGFRVFVYWNQICIFCFVFKQMSLKVLLIVKRTVLKIQKEKWLARRTKLES